MNTLRKYKEGIINKFFGQTYYKRKVIPIIKLKSEYWKRKWTPKKAALILSFDPDETKDIKNVPELLSLLKKYKIKASFAAIGMIVEKHPEIFKQIIKEGHELINHSQTHPDNPEFNPNKNFNKISSKERFEEIKECHKTVKTLLKYEMKGFRVPHFGNQFTKDIYPMLKKLGYKFSSSKPAYDTNNGGFPYKVGDIWEFPIVCSPKYPFCIFDTSHAFRSRFFNQKPDEYLKTFEKLLDDGIKNNMFINIYQDPQDIHKFDYEKMLKIIKTKEKYLRIMVYEDLLAEDKK